MTDWNNIKTDNSKAQLVMPLLKPEDRKETQPKWTDEQVKKWLFANAEKSSSNVCCAIYGFDGTAKSGIAMDCRTEEEIKEGWKVIIFDLDGGCAPLKVIYHNNDPNIIIKNPLVRNEEKNVDYEATFAKLKASLDYIERNLDTLKVKAIIFDGLDKFLKICEYSMREDLNKGVEEGVNMLYWKIRNQKYHDILEQLKSLPNIDRYLITHLKRVEDKSGTMNIIKNNDEWIPDWERKTADLVYQKVKCWRETKIINGDKVTFLKAIIEKCKTNIGLEGREVTIAEIWQKQNGEMKANWNGLRFTSDNKIWQKKGE